MVQQYVGSVVAIGAVVGVLVGGLVAWWLARRVLRPLERLSEGTRRIAAGDLAARVALPPDAELAEVAASFNQMAATLQRVEQLRRSLVEDVAHELRTPLTTLRGYTAALAEGIVQPTPEMLRTVHEEIERLTRLVDALDALARDEAAHSPAGPGRGPPGRGGAAHAGAGWSRPSGARHQRQHRRAEGLAGAHRRSGWHRPGASQTSCRTPWTTRPMEARSQSASPSMVRAFGARSSTRGRTSARPAAAHLGAAAPRGCIAGAGDWRRRDGLAVVRRSSNAIAGRLVRRPEVAAPSSGSSYQPAARHSATVRARHYSHVITPTAWTSRPAWPMTAGH